ncbi:TPA: hypothetical protein ACRZ3R_004416 [Vibrio harveyi]
MPSPNLSKFVLIKFDYVTPEMRFFIAGLLLDFFSEGEFAFPAKELSKKYGVSLNTVNSTLKYLVQSGYAKRSDVSIRRGRPIGRYVFTPILEKKLTDASGWIDSIRPTKFWGQAIQELFNGQNGNAQQSKFSVSNRYLICILALFSNKFGVVNALPASRISKVLGFSSLRLRSQLNALIEKNVLASYTGGVTGKYLFGKAVGVYFLDTEEVAKALNISFDILPFSRMESGSITPERGRYMAYRLYTLKRLLSGDEAGEGVKSVKGEERYQQKFWDYTQEEFSKFVPLFSDTEQTRVIDYLQTKLEQYISFYLTVESESLEEDKQAQFEELKKQIVRECVPKKWQSGGNQAGGEGATFNEAYFVAFSGMLFKLIEGVAKNYIEYFDLNDKKNCSFRIVPYQESAVIESYKQ